MSPIKRLLARVLEYIPYKVGPFTYFMAFLQFYYLYQLAVTPRIGGLTPSSISIVLIPLSMFSVSWLFQVISALCSSSRTRLIIGISATYILYDLLVAYQFGTKSLLDWSVMADNFKSAFSFEAMHVIWNNLDWQALLYIPIVLVPFYILEKRRGTLSKSLQPPSLIKKSIGALLIYSILVLTPYDSYDPYISFFRSIVHYYRNPIFSELTIPEESPFIRNATEFDAIQVEAPKTRPHIFIIGCESLNANRINRRTEDGREITPFLNQLSRESVNVTPFYGNSIQTAKGYFALLFSTIPSLSGLAFVNHEDLNAVSLSSILDDIGYRNLVFSGHDNPNFDNAGPFLNAHDMDFVLSKPYVGSDAIWRRWGPEDKDFFDAFFTYYDTELSQSDEPLFVILKTASHHAPFAPIQQSRRFLYQDTQNIAQDYDNSIYLTDQGVKAFFERIETYPELENSIIIVTSDHAYPLGEHGYATQTMGYHEESFRIPFMMQWKGVLAPQQIDRPSSQMDITPTLLDLLEIEDINTQFIGDSIFSDTNKPIYLVQPYVKHLSVVRYPLKYRFNTRLQKDYLYNLAKDPMETESILSTVSEEEHAMFQRDLRRMYISDYYLNHNLFWPDNESD